jgi:glyoxylate reductase
MALAEPLEPNLVLALDARDDDVAEALVREARGSDERGAHASGATRCGTTRRGELVPHGLPAAERLRRPGAATTLRCENAAAVARCYVTRRLPGRALDRLAEAHEVEVWPERLPPSREVLLEAVRDAEGLLCLLTDRVDDELLAGAPGLRAIANLAVGIDNIDLEAARARGIPVGNTPDVLTEATADLAFALILAAARRLPEAQAAVRDGDWLTWEPEWLLGRDVHGATLGIVGMGRIGGAVARRAQGFSMEVLHTGRSGAGTPLEELLERSDVVSLHAPLTSGTRGLIDTAALQRMKSTAILVNTARGPLVDQRALLEALRAGEIAAAALDVVDPEPLPPDDPLLEAPNLIVLPHLGSATHTARERMADLAVDNLLAALDERPMPHAVP